MASYKVPQDVEAEDKFVGPLSFRQFLFFGAAAISGFIMYQLWASGVGFLNILILPVFLVSVTFGFPWTKDQPTELWLASRIRFVFVAHKRTWNQDNVKNLVTVTAPVVEAHRYTDGLDQGQVHNRLSALASVIDSRGWAVKNSQTIAAPAQSDRLVNVDHAQPAPIMTTDPLDNPNDIVSQQFDSMIKKSEQKRRQDTLEMVSQALNKNSSKGKSKATAVIKPSPAAEGQPVPASTSPWFLQKNQPSNDMAGLKKPAPHNEAEQDFLNEVHKKQELDSRLKQDSRMKTIDPAGTAPPPIPAIPQQNQQQDQTPAGTANASADIMALSQNDDLNIETIARQANKKNELNDNEVVITLHDS